MNILAIDTSVGITVAVLRSDDQVFEASLDSHGIQGELTATLVHQVLQQAGLTPSQVTDVVCGVGPGPFTGLRVGIATAEVFAYALGIEIHAICSLDAIAHDYGCACVVVTNARRKELYWAKYGNTRESQPQVNLPADIPSTQLPFVGPGVEFYPEIISGTNVPLRAGALAQIFASGQAQLVPLEPMYLRKPDAQEPGIRKPVL